MITLNKKPIIIANWKMSVDHRGALRLAQEINDLIDDEMLSEKDVVVCPSFSQLLLVGEILRGSLVSLGSQDIFWVDVGAFTGCESPEFLYHAGVRWAIIGHSERRKFLKETDEMINRKIKSALINDLTPIVCIGESESERLAGHSDSRLVTQLNDALRGVQLSSKQEMIIAYEPIWSIGTGRPIEPDQAEHAFRVIYHTLLDLFPLTIVQNNIRIVYGGSVDGSNAKDFVDLDYFGGFLVGGASLRAEEFISIIKQTKY